MLRGLVAFRGRRLSLQVAVDVVLHWGCLLSGLGEVVWVLMRSRFWNFQPWLEDTQEARHAEFQTNKKPDSQQASCKIVCDIISMVQT